MEPPNGARESVTLAPEEELRLEIPHSSTTDSSAWQNQPTTTSSSSTTTQPPPPGAKCSLLLTSGTAEIFGMEMALQHWYGFGTGCKLAVFTWHGCTLEVHGAHDVLYTSTETSCNVSYVNTHAQLEVMRDEAWQACQQAQQASTATTTGDAAAAEVKVNVDPAKKKGPRVLLCGPPDSGKTRLSTLLTAYAVKLSRSPLLVDLDVSCNLLSVPGTISAAPISSMDALAIQSDGWAVDASKTTPLVYWYGSTELSTQPELYLKLVQKLSEAVKGRLEGEDETNASGMIVNTMGPMVESSGLKTLEQIVQWLEINVILIMGHDRLYSMLKSKYAKNNKEDSNKEEVPIIIKLPRSGGVVSRDATFRRQTRAASIRRYFHGNVVPLPRPPAQPSDATTLDSTSSSNNNANSNNATTNNGTTYVHRFTPNLLEKGFAELQLYKTTKVSLSRGMLPVSGMQQSKTIQLVHVNGNTMDTTGSGTTGIGSSAAGGGGSGFTVGMRHALFAVCHPTAVEMYQRGLLRSQEEEEQDHDTPTHNAAAMQNHQTENYEEALYASSVAGFVSVDRVDAERERVSLLSPCSGELPSEVLLMGDITWME